MNYNNNYEFIEKYEYKKQEKKLFLEQSKQQKKYNR